MSHDSPCRVTRVHLGLTQQCTLGLGHSRPHTYPPIGEAEYAALLQRVEALREERDAAAAQSFSGHDWNRLLNERDAARAAQKRAEEERGEANRVARDLTRSLTAAEQDADKWLHEAEDQRARALAAESALAAASETSARLTSELARALDGQREAETALAALGAAPPDAPREALQQIAAETFTLQCQDEDNEPVDKRLAEWIHIALRYQGLARAALAPAPAPPAALRPNRCSRCGGSGQWPDGPCDDCGGSGWLLRGAPAAPASAPRETAPETVDRFAREAEASGHLWTATYLRTAAQAMRDSGFKAPASAPSPTSTDPKEILP